MTMQLRAFRPLALTQNIAVTATAQTQTLNLSIGTFAIRFVNVGTQTVFVVPQEAINQVTATVNNGVPILANTSQILTVSQGTLGFSVIAGATGSVLYSTVGEGL